MCSAPPALLSCLPFPNFFRVIKAQYEQKQKEELYRIYTADTLLFISESVSKALGGRCMANRYTDFSDPQPEETRSQEEIIADIGAKLDKMGGEDNG